jgi:uncharacterized protein YuzE
VAGRDVSVSEFVRMLPAVMRAPHGFIWTSYDAAADVLYVNFKKPANATDSELQDDDIIVRYEGDEVIGLTILHASRR